MENIEDKSMAELVDFYNKHSGKPPLKKFRDKASAIERVKKLLPRIGAAPKKGRKAKTNLVDYKFKGGETDKMSKKLQATMEEVKKKPFCEVAETMNPRSENRSKSDVLIFRLYSISKCGYDVSVKDETSKAIIRESLI